jgi:hypothetical protein
MVDQFLSLVFIKVSIGKHCSSFTKLITCTTSSTNLMYSRIFYSRICDKKRVLHNLVSRSSSNDFYINNLALFFMVRTDKNLYRSRAMAENSLGTHISLGPHLLRFTKFKNCQMNNKPCFGFWLQLVWEVHNLKFIHQILS